ncbi:putative uncharacterized protein DDB_G0291608 [Chenopodium quinoa]|uniref:putative uncharacterized protein DDB_G0291608 n=1 Tax=Chenopodium quinoa TaxID=63459 RepID=UPI000B7726D9|nr:putative uncharacterized protein DDB_G0291608 [Chenopodium quinoa]
MHPSPSSVMGTSSKGDSARYSNGSNFSDDEAGIFMTIDNEKGAEFFAIEPPRAVLTRDSSEREKQISVDPISLQGSNTIRQASFRLVSPPTNQNLGPNAPPSPSPPPKLKFVSSSLPGSNSSSPESLYKKYQKNHSQQAAAAPRNNLSRMQSVMDDTHLAMVEANTRKSKSLGEGRTSGPVDDFDLWLEKSSHNSGKDQSSSSNNNNNNNSNKHSGFSKPPLGPGIVDRHSSTMKKSKSRDPSFSEEKFKCGKLCLFLPRGKGKTVRSISTASTMTQASCKSEPMAISRRVSLEKFECGSWASSLENEEGESANLFFDLPMELLRCSVSDMQSPVTAAFVFDNDDDNDKEEDDKDNNKDAQMAFHAFLEAQS